MRVDGERNALSILRLSSARSFRRILDGAQAIVALAQSVGIVRIVGDFALQKREFGCVRSVEVSVAKCWLSDLG
jgi:hypothetical protein